jgi:nitrate reductase gamma subunit
MALNVFAYLAILIFLAAVIYRVIRVMSTPVHLRWELYPVPHETGKKAKYGGSYLEESDWWTKSLHGSKLGEAAPMLSEILLLKGVWENNRGLWFWSWAFHFGLYFAIGVIFLLVVATIFGPISMIGKIILDIAGVIAAVGYILGAMGCFGMLIKRTTDNKLKSFTAPATIFNLLFILAIFVTGLIAMSRPANAGFAFQLQQFLARLVTFGQAAPINQALSVHIAVTLLFMAYMPFTHMAHFVLKYFTYHSIRWNDQPNFKGSKLEGEVLEALKYKPTWAAKHIGADGKKNWVDIAIEEVRKDEK